ncbi:MAG TPA: hypothetical protein PLS49_06025 [Candidatus Woesebacteria bacterium]|nr:hypothetical protein [Candidatus Woesebacteria bacterium]
MNNVNKTDLYERIKQFQQRTLTNQPSREEMISDVRMMNFKVRPVYGNISKLDFNNSEFLNAIWSLGKLDEFFKEEFFQVEEEDRDIFFKLIDDMRIILQKKLNNAYKAQEQPKKNKLFFEIEIFKENLSQVN